MGKAQTRSDLEGDVPSCEQLSKILVTFHGTVWLIGIFRICYCNSHRFNYKIYIELMCNCV